MYWCICVHPVYSVCKTCVVASLSSTSWWCFYFLREREKRNERETDSHAPDKASLCCDTSIFPSPIHHCLPAVHITHVPVVTPNMSTQYPNLRPPIWPQYRAAVPCRPYCCGWADTVFLLCTLQQDKSFLGYSFLKPKESETTVLGIQGQEVRKMQVSS